MLSKNNRVRVVPLEGVRGRIKDRNDIILADNKVNYQLMVTPQEIVDIKDLFSFLSETLASDQEYLINTYRSNKINAFTPVLIKDNLSKKQAIIIEENRYRFPCLIVHSGFKRFYPLEKNSAHVLGYVGKVNRAKVEKYKEYGLSVKSLVGYQGVEEFYDSYLKGIEGGIQIEVNNKGKQVMVLGIKDPHKGEDITLTIDSRIQELSSEMLGEKIGSIVIMDSENGEILSLVNSPSYDPNMFVDPAKQKSQAYYVKNKNAPLLNRAVQAAYPPGSVFKSVVALAGLDTRKINDKTTFFCDRVYELGGMEFKCTHRHGPQNVIESLAHSCNIFYYHLGQKLGADLISKYAKLFELGEITHIDLPYERSGFIPNLKQNILSSRRKWFTGDTLNFSIGQGEVLTTPLQLVNMMSIIANDGDIVQPHIIKKIGEGAAGNYDLKRNLNINRSYFKDVKKGLRAAVGQYSGTAYVLNLTNIFVAGKTGTAQSSPNKDHHSWFVGYFKINNKTYSFCVFLEHGGSSINACLVARELLLSIEKMKLL